MPNALAHAYLELPLGERDAALTSLIRSLGRREQALLQSLISDTRDPFHRLPTELLLHVFDFLHPFEVWSKRLVCRRWNNALSLDLYTRTALDRFETHDHADSALVSQTQTSYSQTLALRHILALRSGQPSSYVNLDDQFAFLPYSYPVAHQLRLKGKRIAYLRGDGQSGQGNVVVIRDLTTGETTTLRGTARENIISIELTSDIVAFFTYTGIMYVASLLNLTDTLQSIRLPSSSILATGSNRGTMVCIFSGARTPIAVIYDTRTRRTTSFGLKALQYDNAALDHRAVSINTHEQGFEIFSADSSIDDSAESNVEVLRYSFDGECINHTSSTISHGSVANWIVSLGPAEPTGERGTCQLTMSYLFVPTGSPPAHSKPLCYTTRRTLLFDTFKFTLKSIDLTGHDAVPNHIRDYRSYDPAEYPRPALWKDRLYRASKKGVDWVNHRSAPWLDTARRPGPDDGPHTLYHLCDEARAAAMPSVHDTEGEDEVSDVEDDCDCACHPSATMRASHWHPGSSASFLRNQQCISPFKVEEYMLPQTMPGMSPESERKPEKPPLHTIVAMNDSFAVATTLDLNKIGILCFDERVMLHGATKVSYD